MWTEHIDHDWSARRVRLALSRLPGLILQDQRQQTPFKISYYYDRDHAPTLDELNTLLRQQEITANAGLSFGQFLDVLPARAQRARPCVTSHNAWRYRSSRCSSPAVRARTRI